MYDRMYIRMYDRMYTTVYNVQLMKRFRDAALYPSTSKGFRGVDNGYHKMLYYTYNGGMHVEERRLGKGLTVTTIK